MSQSLDVDISVVSPVYGCSRYLPELVDRVKETLSHYAQIEIILVCDHSPDDSWKVIKRLAEEDERVKGLLLAKNVGQHHAISAGLNHASGRVTVVLDCDLQDQPEEAAKLVCEIESGAHIAIAQSPFRGRSSRIRTYARHAYFRALDVLDAAPGSSRHGTHSFFALSSTARSAFNLYGERVRQVSVILRDLGFDPVFVPIEHLERRDLGSSYSSRDRVNLAFEGFVLYGSKVLKYLTVLSFMLFLATVSLAVVMFARHLFGGATLPGWFSTIQLLLIITSIQLLSMGVMGIYLHLVLTELRQRPGYVVAESTPADASP